MGKDTTKTRRRSEWGDFQTPPALAREVGRLIAASRVRPASVVEPTCGKGAFLEAALTGFRGLQAAFGLDIDETYVEACRARLEGLNCEGDVRVQRGCFFASDWAQILGRMPEPILVIGNPPWVTNSVLSTLGSTNLPDKSNAAGRRGIDAMTGKSNFDISEWMIDHLLEVLDGRDATVAMLCKTKVARQVLVRAWRAGRSPGRADLFGVDAARSFGAAVDAGLLVCHLGRERGASECRVHSSLAASSRDARAIGLRDDRLVADVELYQRWAHLQGAGERRWRSGIKHDCARVMELIREGSQYRNGLGEVADLEDAFLYPMRKSSELSRGAAMRRFMLVPQRTPGDPTGEIARTAPRTWRYLLAHAELLDRRASSIYRKRSRFAVFGVGPYAFTPWKVAISGFYKKLEFTAVGPFEGRPVVFDDTCYLLPCASQAEAEHTARLLNSPAAQGFFRAFVFFDDKRPITAQLLRRLDLSALADQSGA